MAKANEKSGLSDRVRLFCHEYVRDMKKQDAARRAGYSRKSAASQASAILKNPKAQQLIRELQRKKFNRLEISAERVLQEAARIGFLDIRKAYDEHGNLKNIQDLDDDTAAAIAGIESEELFEGRGEDREHVGTLKKIKTCDKPQMIVTLMKHLRLLDSDTPPPAPAPAETPAVTIPMTAEEIHEFIRNRMSQTRAENHRKSGRKG